MNTIILANKKRKNIATCASKLSRKVLPKAIASLVMIASQPLHSVVSNNIKHGIDFLQAQRLCEDPDCIIIPARSIDEPRFVIIARRGEEIWSAIYILRGEVIRIIFVRRSRQNEKEIYKR